MTLPPESFVLWRLAENILCLGELPVLRLLAGNAFNLEYLGTDVSRGCALTVIP